MILCDAGPLVALQDEDDPHHNECILASKSLPADGLLTTWPCIAEAMYLLGRFGGFRAQQKLWDLIESDVLRIHQSSEPEIRRMRVLMNQYRDAPMDLADASLVATAEALGMDLIFTLDSHFRAYRIEGKRSFEMLP